MTHEEIAEQLLDELQHNKITNYQEYSDRLYELLDKAHPDDERVGDYVGDVENIMHNRESFGFCDMCGEYINYDTDAWYDLGMIEPEEADVLDITYPYYRHQTDDDIVDVCSACFHKLVDKEEMRKIPLIEVGINGGKSHANETLGEFMDEVGLTNTYNIDNLSKAFEECGVTIEGWEIFK